MKDEGSEIISKHNHAFLQRHLASEKQYLDNILKQVDPVINLDDEQRKVVLSDEDYTLVIAGAGAGKTTTVAAKVKYLVEKKNINPDQILVISFTNKAVGELRSKINKALKINCPVTTFHKTGYAILRRQDEERKLIVEGGFMFNVISNYLKGNILENPELVDKLILFFGSYFDAPYEGDDLNTFFNYIAKADFSTLRGNMSEFTEQIINQRTGKQVTIARETLRSSQEVRIANFLYLNNIEYTYEKPYQYNIIYSHKPYTPDFTITQGDKIAYIEHFGITEDGKNNRYTEEDKSENMPGGSPSFKIRFELKNYNSDLQEADDADDYSIYNNGDDSHYSSSKYDSLYMIIAIVAVLFIIGLSVGLYVLVAVMAKNRNRSVVLWILLSIVASPLLIIIILLVVGDDNKHIDNYDMP